MTQAAQSAVFPGFPDPVHDAQSCFRSVLTAMSQPGRLVELRVTPPVPSLDAASPAAGLCGMVAVALTLCDADTPVWLDARLDTPAMRQHLRFHCGCPLVPEPGRAGFAFIGDAGTMPRFERFSSGSPEYPDRSATLVIAAAMHSGAADQRLTGPGISPARNPGGMLLGLAGLPAWFWEEWSMNQAGYPQGVDVLFVDSRPRDGDSVRIVGLPRTTSAVPACPSESRPVKENRPCTLQ